MLPNFSKVYEKNICNELYKCFNDKLFPSQYGFHKRCSSQHIFLVMTEKFKESVDKGNAFGALLTNLLKVFDCMDHTLLIAKLSTFDFSTLSLRFIYSFLLNRNQRIKLLKNFSNRTDIEFGVPQDFVFGPI